MQIIESTFKPEKKLLILNILHWYRFFVHWYKFKVIFVRHIVLTFLILSKVLYMRFI